MHYGSNGPQLDFDGICHTSTPSNGVRMPSAHSFPLFGRKYTACEAVCWTLACTHTHCCATDWVSSVALQAKAACGIGWVCCVRVACSLKRMQLSCHLVRVCYAAARHKGGDCTITPGCTPSKCCASPLAAAAGTRLRLHSTAVAGKNGSLHPLLCS